MTDNKILKNANKIYRINLQTIMKETDLDFSKKIVKVRRKLLRLSPTILCHSMSRTFCSHVAMLQTSVDACRFQNEYNNMEIALRVVQFWSGLKLVITLNRTTALLSCDFVITCLIQCNYHY